MDCVYYLIDVYYISFLLSEFQKKYMYNISFCTKSKFGSVCEKTKWASNWIVITVIILSQTKSQNNHVVYSRLKIYHVLIVFGLIRAQIGSPLHGVNIEVLGIICLCYLFLPLPLSWLCCTFRMRLYLVIFSYNYFFVLFNYFSPVVCRRLSDGRDMTIAVDRGRKAT